jgi:hypothetical protein
MQSAQVELAALAYQVAQVALQHLRALHRQQVELVVA